MNLRRLNRDGLIRFEAFLSELRLNPLLSPPFELLQDPGTSEEVANLNVEASDFTNRLDAARWLNDTFEAAALQDPTRDKGLWAWLSLLLFNSVCPPESGGNRKPGEVARHIPEATNFQRYYRHLLAGPWRIFRAYRDSPDSALALLCQPLHRPGEIVEQLASRQELVTNRGFVSAATRLYVDATTREPRKGSGGKLGGSPRRLADFCNQVDVTWDLYAMEAEELLEMLPGEFDRFRQ